MRLPTPRFSLRTLLIAVTVVSIGCAIGGGLWKRSMRLQKLSEFHYSQANTFMQVPSSMVFSDDLSLPVSEEQRKYELGIDSHLTWQLYHGELAMKYLAAAKKPWLIVPDDPPEPVRP